MVLVLTGPSGAGKDTITNQIMEQSNFVRFPTCTTRAPRADEIEGIHYHFVDKETFNKLWEDGQLLDHAGVHDYYGLPIKKLKEELQAGKSLVVHLVPKSAMALKQVIPQSVTILILPPTPKESLRRLSERGMSQRNVTRRLENDETKNYDDYKYDLVLVNETCQAKQTVRKILTFLARKR